MTPLTYAQRNLINLEPAALGAQFLVRAAYRVAHELDLVVLSQAIADVIARHDALRTTIGPGPDGMLAAQVHPPMHGRLLVQEVIDETDFALADPPLLRVHIGQFTDGSSLLVIVAHHLAADTWSLPLLARDLAAAYTARLHGDQPLSTDVMQYAEVATDDYAPSWEQTITDALPYWRSQLDGADKTPVSGPLGPQRMTRFLVPADLWKDTVRTARRNRTTPFVLLLTAYVATLWPGRGDVLAPILTPGRKPSEWYTIGYMANTLWLRIITSDPGNLEELMHQVDKTCRAAYAHDIPVLRVLSEEPELATAAFPTFQTIPKSPFSSSSDSSALVLVPVPGEHRPTPARPLLWTMHLEDQVTGHVSYAGNLFNNGWIDEKVNDYLCNLGRLTK